MSREVFDQCYIRRARRVESSPRAHFSRENRTPHQRTFTYPSRRTPPRCAWSASASSASGRSGESGQPRVRTSRRFVCADIFSASAGVEACGVPRANDCASGFGFRGSGAYLPGGTGDKAEAHADGSLRGHVHLGSCAWDGSGGSGQMPNGTKTKPNRVGFPSNGVAGGFRANTARRG